MRKGDIFQFIDEFVRGELFWLKQRMLEGRRVIIGQVEREHTGLYKLGYMAYGLRGSCVETQ